MPPQPRTARFLAAETLCRLYRSRTPVKPLFDRQFDRHGLAAGDRALAMQLVYGVLRRRQQLDRILELLSRTPLAKIDDFVHQALAVGLYQLFFLDRIPESAAVNEAVQSCKAARLPPRLQGFVNGVLRQAIRQRNHLAAASRKDRSGRPIVDHPLWLYDRWCDHFGAEEALRICRANGDEPQLVLRINRRLIDRDHFCRLLRAAAIDCRPGSYGEASVVLPTYHGSVASLPGYGEGLFAVQDEAAQLATLLLGPLVAAGRYLDGCAGLGGKTAHLVELATGLDLDLHAVEPEPHRLEKLGANLARLSPVMKPTIHRTTLAEFSASQPGLEFDGILIDAPCSGTGVAGRHPDIRWNRLPEDLPRYAGEQTALLELAASHLKPGGVLVYATCSLEPEENRQVVDRFLLHHNQFHLTDCRVCLPEPARTLVKDWCFQPHPDETIDGFFAARMVRSLRG